MSKQFTVGIDLGTSNTVVAYAAPGTQDIELFEIEQLVGLGQVAARPLLPSVRYHSAPGEISPGDLQLPWTPEEKPLEDQAKDGDRALVGRLALDLGAQVPGRLVASAKSWLSHASVDRMAAILPWGADSDIGKISPVAASASYLAHVRAAWRHRFPYAPLEKQQLILTVPASFDEGARALTLEAARQAGLPQLRLLEEPQAAFYDWIFRHRQSLADELAETRLLMVCDVGGGTTDLTLIQVAMQDGQPELTRIGVGNHLMLGGDNMDLALAHLVESRLPGTEEKLTAARFSQLTARCRAAKELLLGEDAPEAVPLTLLGGGSRLIGSARTIELKRNEVRQLLVDGFFPHVGPDDPVQQRRAAIVEFGLPYPADPAITRHVADFLKRHADVSRQAQAEANNAQHVPVPDTLLFNGGVFRSRAIAERLQSTLGDWRGAALRVLHNDNPDIAVARGAVAYALVRQGHGRRIGGGSARSYFLVLEGQGKERSGICILPRGSEEGLEVQLPERIFSLRLGQPVRFHLVSSVADTHYEPGEIAALAGEDFVSLPPIATVVQAHSGITQREVRVQLISTMTEVGTLELHCVSVEEAKRRWLLEFQLRGADAGETAGNERNAPDVPTAALPAKYADAIRCIESIFGARSSTAEKADLRKEVRHLRGQLEHLLGKRENWEMPLLRALFDALMQRARRRRRSAEHERSWLNLAGFCLRPGLGSALDEWRIEQLIQLLPQGIEYVGESQNWSEWWTLWRRAAGGLPSATQEDLLNELSPWLLAKPAKKASRLATAIAGSHDDMLRLVASLEDLPVERKVEIGAWLVEGLRNHSIKPLGWWALGRLGARRTLYGSHHRVVPPDVAGQWLEALLEVDWKKIEAAAFAATQIARLTGDRSRDLPEPIRDLVLSRLRATNASAGWINQIQNVVEIDLADERRAFGESLPAGLRLVAEAR
ncbi:Hsp70 family protein [Propionivibrio sp.]|uniref:Hsp70 family protein n=1 Tax=Propionivibrio sp. TaxID=2212460 RepID=UPI0025E9EC9D|nr:Hsp70 family protein [Propionivibrio sp.]MBK7356571.1 hsp70 family protein [Propionivibrio sp.]